VEIPTLAYNIDFKSGKNKDQDVSSCCPFFLLQVKAEIIVHDDWDVADGILELVDSFWIRTLVMGAASDKRYSKYVA
jgi:hypothetical protein